MFENILNFLKGLVKKEKNKESSDTAKERLHLVLMQDRANVSADFLELMKQEIIEVIKKYIDVDEKEIDVHLTNKANEDGTVGAPALYANIPIVTIKNEARKLNVPTKKEENEKEKNINKPQEQKKSRESKLEEQQENKAENTEQKESQQESEIKEAIVSNIENVEEKNNAEQNLVKTENKKNKEENNKIDEQETSNN